jgi:hypothetical protein
MTDKCLIRSYVWHEGQCFYVSTIDRDSSAMLGPRRFAETIVWKFDFDANVRGEQMSMHSGLEGSVFTHLKVCGCLHETGSPHAGDIKHGDL